MKKYEELNQNEQNEIIQKAKEFNQKYTVHVAELMNETKESVAPSGSDLFNPELWKGIHWRWFYRSPFIEISIEEVKKLIKIDNTFKPIDYIDLLSTKKD